MSLIYENPGTNIVIVYGDSATCSAPVPTTATLPTRTLSIEISADVGKMEKMWRDIRHKARRSPRIVERSCRGKCHCGSGVDARFCGCHKPARRNALPH